uniref:Fe2OG dioxygenase domain-containing protein n=1 Tax=Leersia perrieri TaxID=77586 RepID=A0A0D9XCT4_9ORYZ
MARFHETGVFKREIITEDAAMAFVNSYQIPDRYNRADEVQVGAVVGNDKVTNEGYGLPVVDMARLLDPEHREKEIAWLGSACRDWGFFQLINHGVDEVVIEQMKGNTLQFFELPLEDKNSVAARPYSIEGFGHHFNRLSTDKLEWAESMLLNLQPTNERKIEFWPSKPPTFRDSIENYSKEMWNLATQLLTFMASDLGVDQETLLAAFRGKRQSSSLHRYPPCRHPEKVMGAAPHTDGLALTILLHVDDTPGLQISKDGLWHPVQPLPGAFVINIGEILEVLTNGSYKSVLHRVLVDAERGRATIVVFHDASIGGVVKPLPELGEARYRSIERPEFSKGFLRALSHGKERFLDTLKI